MPLTIVDRGADRLVAEGRLAKTAADALKDEARRRVQGGQFCGHIAYASLIPIPKTGRATPSGPVASAARGC